MDSKTTVAGIIGLVGTICALVGGVFHNNTWGQILLAIGVALKGADSIGNVLSQDQLPSAAPKGP